MDTNISMTIETQEQEVVCHHSWKNVIEYVKSDDLSVFNNDIESLFIEVTNMKSSSGRAIVVGVIYRPPDQNINEFSITMSTNLDKLKSEKKRYLPIRWL